MKIIRTEGQSYTVSDQASGGLLKRGLRRSRSRDLTPKYYRDRLDLSPADLQKYLIEDYRLIIRQVVSIFDKVIQKPRRLGQCDLDTYVDRTHLGEALWKLIENRHGDDVAQLGESAAREFRLYWQSKVHPYAEHECSQSDPANDQNAKVILRNKNKDAVAGAFKGRWRDAFWRVADSRPDYEAIAAAIWSHLTERELKTNGKVRSRTGSTEHGLISARAESISESAQTILARPVGCEDDNDYTLNSAETRLKRRQVLSNSLGDDMIENMYFEEDIAAAIAGDTFSQFLNVPDTDIAKTLAASYGASLYRHFGGVLSRKGNDKATGEKLWALHNFVRKFYRELAASTRFRLACSGPTRDQNKLEQLIPRNRYKLMAILRAKAKNADLGTFIRLGKLIAHASDLPKDTNDPATAFRQRLRFYSTSEGQSEIKRNEAFARIWRSSVALSVRTLEVLAPVQQRTSRLDSGKGNSGARKNPPFDRDPASTSYAKAAYKQFDQDIRPDFSNRIGLIFGNKRRGWLLQPDVLKPGKHEGELAQEVMWALLRLGGEIRNSTSHFNTKRRLTTLITSGVLVEDNQDIDNRSGPGATRTALAAFGRLLHGDIAMQRQAIIDTFRQTKVHEYVSPSNIDELFAEFQRAPDKVGLTVPKFMTVLNNVSGLSQARIPDSPAWVTRLSGLKLENLSKQPDNANRFQISVFRHLYETGFESWLAENAADPAFLAAAFKEIISFKKRRIDHFRGEEKSRGIEKFYALTEVAAESFLTAEDTTLNGFISELHSLAMSEDAIRRTYRAEPHLQRDRSNWVIEFRLDLFAYLFSKYLAPANVAWLLKITEKLPESERADPVILDKYAGPKWTFEIKPWHSQFYAWLYLVPPDDIALLRHQFRKTHALEGKAADVTLLPTLTEIDRLMGLYLSINAAGFDGTEHKAVLRQAVPLPNEANKDSEDLIATLLEDMKQHAGTLPGTNRGLRQLLSLGTHKSLSGIFNKHPVLPEELAALKALMRDPEAVEKDSTEQNRLAKEIIDKYKSGKFDAAELRNQCARYEKAATANAIYNFHLAGARLRDHARLHHLFIRVLDRLLDFTLLWERDRQYAYSGMLYRQFQDGLAAPDAKSAPEAEPASELPDDVSAIFDRIKWVDGKRGAKLGFDLPPELKERYLGLFNEWPKKPKEGDESGGGITHADAHGGFLPLWHERFGYVLRGDTFEAGLLSEENRRLFKHFFDRAEAKNAKDVEANERWQRKMQQRRDAGEIAFIPALREGRYNFEDGRTTIRNDFAHFNMLDRGKPNLTFLVNSVRSLLAYDRKLKNAVSQSIADMVADEGLVIRWKLIGDRLRTPVVIPALTRHLGYLRKADEPLAFGLPKVSLRYTSMVMALFNFDTGGYRERVAIGDEIKANGELKYPSRFWPTEKEMRMRVPTAILELKHEPLKRSGK